MARPVPPSSIPLPLLLAAVLISVVLFARAVAVAQSNPAPASGWPMHEIDNAQIWLANGLSAADADRDGFLDFVTNYEWRGQIRIAFHPGPGREREKWPAMELTARPHTERFGIVPNVENAAFGDLDGDGNPDVVYVTGSERPAVRSAVRVFWGPSPDKARDLTGWTDGGFMKASFDKGHMHYIRIHDVNRDGAPDLFIGGREHEVYGTWAGLKWFEAPAEARDRRDFNKWQLRYIDPDVKGAYGATFQDLDGDGDEDVALGNADFDTPLDEQMIAWYENPGPGTEAQKQPWRKTILYQGPDFYVKVHMASGDLNGDGRNDLVAPTENALYYFKNLGGTPPKFERIVIRKPPETNWLQRGTKIVDLNGDGRMDIFGMLIWKKTPAGNALPKDKAAVYWMEYKGKEPGPDNWTTHVIKPGSGFSGTGWWGEKWDQSIFYDVDRDGDLDVVANVEEFHDVTKVYLAVVWFENPLRKR